MTHPRTQSSTSIGIRVWAAAIAIGLPFAAAQADSGLEAALDSALTETKLNLNVRYRFETVDQDGLPEDAVANTIRTRFGFETGALYDFKIGVEAENVAHIGRADFNDTVNGRVRYPVVADPDNTELNQYYVSNTSLPETMVKLGRQRVIFDNHRFVGTVGFRQNEQTFDALRVTTQIVPDVEASYLYMYLVNRIFGEDSAVGDFESNNHLVNIAYTGSDIATIVGYAYLLDFDEAPALSSKTFGLRVKGARALATDWKLFYTAEAAWQSDHGDNPNSDSFFYTLLEPGIGYGPASLRVGYELLSGNGRRAFQTPLATLHAFQGWADKFLTTPGGGIEDIYVRFDYTAQGLGILDGTKLTAVYHHFAPEESGDAYGQEYDLQISRGFFKYVTASLKYAYYDADAFATDTQKFWAMVTFKY